MPVNRSSGKPRLSDNRILRWLIVGGVSAIVDANVYALFIVLQGGIWVANLFAISIGGLVNFLLHRIWTFSDAQREKIGTIYRYVAQYSLTYLLTSLGLTLISTNIDPFEAKLLVILVMSPIGYFLLRFWVFPKKYQQT
jgi:putative flippase GtrA